MTPVQTPLNATAPTGIKEKGSLWSRMLFWITIALDPEAVAWNWGGFTPALLSYSEALRATGRPASALDATKAVANAKTQCEEDTPADTFQRAA